MAELDFFPIENYPPILDEVFSAAEAERLWGLAPGTVRAALLRDVIRGRKSGGTWLVARATMEAHYYKQPPKKFVDADNGPPSPLRRG